MNQYFLIASVGIIGSGIFCFKKMENKSFKKMLLDSSYYLYYSYDKVKKYFRKDGNKITKQWNIDKYENMSYPICYSKKEYLNPYTVLNSLSMIRPPKLEG